MKKRPLFGIGAAFVLLLSLLLQWKKELFYSAALAAEDSFSTEEKVTFQGIVKSVQINEEQTVLTLKDACLIVENTSYKSKGLLVYVEGSHACNPGETLYGKGLLKKITDPENPGQFHARSYYNGKKVDYRIFSAKILKRDGKKDYYLSFLQFLKEKMMYGLSQTFDKKDAGILQSMLLGDKDGMEEDTYALYQLAGIAHVFAISGLHVGLVGRGLYGFLRKIGLKFGSAFLVSSGMIVSYGILTGGSPSAIRAIIMFGISIFAKVCGRPYDLLTAIMVALVSISIENPYSLQQSGVWLSFGAVLAIGIVYPCLQEFFQPKNTLWQSFLVSFSVHIFTVPILAYSYFQFSTYGVFLNLAVIPLMTLVFVSGALAGVIGIFLPFVGMFFGGMAHYILVLYDKLCQLYIQLPGAVFLTGKPEKWQVFLYYVLLFAGLLGLKKFAGGEEEIKEKKEKKEKKGKNCKKEKERFCWKQLGVLIPLALLVVVLLPLPSAKLNITMVDVGQGDGIFIQSPDKNQVNLFIDGGSSDVKGVGTYRILPFLKAKGVNHIHKWLITHGDSDHYSGLVEILEEVKKGQFFIDTVCLPKVANPGEGYEVVCQAVLDAGVKLEYVSAGMKWKTGKMKLEFLHPEENYESESENAYSAVFLLEYGAFRGLFTGDVEGDGEKQLEKYFSANEPLTLLKVAHHGSANSTTDAFCALVKPEIAFISAGVANFYGHPAKAVLNRLKEEPCQIYSTQELGAVWVKTDGKTVKVGWQMEK